MKNYLSFLWICFSIIACDSNGSSEVELLEKWWTEEDRQLIVSELNRTTDELRVEINNLTDDQWYFREDSTRWSIGEIVEHLEMQNQLHFREISVTSKAPQAIQFRLITKGRDAFFTNYSTDTIRSKAQWYLEPLGRYCTVKDGQFAFYLARLKLTQLVAQTNIDFRKQFTFRLAVEGKRIKDIKIGQVRDLHQLLLTGIAHTDRHLSQIRKIKRHQDYPVQITPNL